MMTTPVMKKATPEVSMNRTFVFWDIKSFPVPPGFDPRRVRQCIQRLLKNYDYDGPVTIYAVGMITDVHDDILRALSSTGIILHYAPYGTSDIMSLMFECMEDNPPPANILGICYPRAFATPQSGFNLFRPFPYSSPQEDAISWINLILEVSGSLKHEDTCLATDESASWFCTLCYDHPPGQGFDSFTSHLSSPEHVLTRTGHLTIGDNEPMSKFEDEDGKPSPIVWWRPMKPTRDEAVADTLVIWDINMFPVPSGFDARQVGPCIKRFLELHGYCGHHTINAVGLLTDVPPYILEALSSTGINLCDAPHGASDIMLLMSQWISKNPPPANILGICDPRGFPPPLSGYNLFRPFSYSSPEEDAFLWESSLLAAGGVC